MTVKNLKTNAPAQGCSTREERVRARNRVLVARYFYWTELRRRRFDDVMRILAESEFFVEERTIMNAINAYSVYLDELRLLANAARSLRKEHPSWNWS